MSRFLNIPKSTYIKGIEWIGERVPYPEADIKGDSFPMTWSGDGEIYTSSGDPLWGESISGLDVQKFSGGPTDYKITKVNHMNDYTGMGGEGPKPCGMICVNGILYLAVQNLCGMQVPPFGQNSQHASDATILYSYSGGNMWSPSFQNIKEPMFPGSKFGSPSFINFGQNNANARDNYVYAVSGDQWDNGSNLRLGRVPNDSIIRREAWEWVCSFLPSGEPAWSCDLNEAVPILSLHRWLGMPEMVYMAGIKRYLLLSWRLHSDFSPTEGSDLMIFESPEPWGPFSLVHFEENWEGKSFNPYTPRLPLKWVESDGITCWLQFSGSWATAGNSDDERYRSNVRKMKIIL